MTRRLRNIPAIAALSSGDIINTTRFISTTRDQLSQTSSVRNIISINVTKLKSNAQSYLLVRGIVPMYGFENWPTIGLFANLDGNRMGQDEAAYGNVIMAVPSQNYEHSFLEIEKSFESSDWDASQTAGSHTVNVGWYSPGGITKPAQWVNPNSANESRIHQQGTHVVVFEVAR